MFDGDVFKFKAIASNIKHQTSLAMPLAGAIFTSHEQLLSN